MLRKIAAILLVIAVIFSLVGCGGGKSSSETESFLDASVVASDESSEVSGENSFEADKTSSEKVSSKVNNLPSASIISDSTSSKDIAKVKTVSVTVPAYLLSEELDEGLTAEQKAMGFVSMKVNDDYSITYEIAETEYDAFLFTQRNTCAEVLQEIITSGDFPSVKEITYDTDMAMVTVLVDGLAYNESNDNWAVPSVAVCAMVYRVFKTKGNPECEVLVVDKETKQVISHDAFPDILGY